MRHLTIFLSIALLGNAGAAVSGLYTYTVNPDNVSVTITDYPTYATGAIDIPATIDGRSVTSIGNYAFSSSSLTSVTIPDSVTSIGEYAFWNCTGLTSITIPDSVTSIGYEAFSICTGLTSATIGNSVTSIGRFAFQNCTGLTNVTIGNSVTSILEGAFWNCTGLTSITIGNSVTSIGRIAFYNCTNLASIRFEPRAAPTIGSDAFTLISSTAIIQYPYGATGYAASYDGVSTEQAAAPTFGLYTYEINSENVSVTITDYPTNATGAIEIPAIIDGRSVTSIGGGAFFQCSGLTSITIPDSVTSIGDYAFSGTNLTYSSVDGVKYLFSDSYAFLIDGSSASGDLSLPSNVDSKPVRLIADSAFSGSSSLTSVTIPDSVTSIGDYAFSGCTGLTSITIPDSVTSIGEYAFYECYGLTSVTIGNSVTSIGTSAFERCLNLVSIRLESMTAPTIASDAFLSISAAAIIYYPYGATGYAATYRVPTTDNGFTVDDLNTAVASATTQGQQDVVADPASYGLYTSTEVASSRTAGQQDVVADPANYGLYTSATAQAQLIDLRTGSTMLNIDGLNAVMQLQIQRSDDLSTWTSSADDIITVELPMPVGKGFYRFAMPQE